MTIIILFALCRSLSGVNPGEVVPYHGHLVTSQMNTVICFNIIVINELQKLIVTRLPLSIFPASHIPPMSFCFN